MSAIDNSEVGQPNSTLEQDDRNLAGVMKTNSSDKHINMETYKIRKPKRILHFSDGTLEEDDTDSDIDDENQTDNFHKLNISEVQAEPSENPKSLSWPAWFQHYTARSAHKTLGALDSAGETIAYYLGITTPKYQYEIDEYNRIQEEIASKKKEREEELASWGNTGRANSAPITTEDKIHDMESQVQVGGAFSKNQSNVA